VSLSTPRRPGLHVGHCAVSLQDGSRYSRSAHSCSSRPTQTLAGMSSMLSRSALAEILPVQRVISLVAEVGQLVHVPLAGLRPRIVIHYLAESGVPEDRRYVVHDGAQQGGRQEDNARRAAAGLRGPAAGAANPSPASPQHRHSRNRHRAPP
jgi:hypothetical protein